MTDRQSTTRSLSLKIVSQFLWTEIYDQTYNWTQESKVCSGQRYVETDFRTEKMKSVAKVYFYRFATDHNRFLATFWLLKN